MQKEKQLHKDSEIINSINSAKRMLIASDINGRSEAMTQITCLLGYKYLSNNIANNSGDIGYELNEEFRYENLLINKGEVIGLLKLGIEQITHHNHSIQASDVFFDLFDMIDFEKFNNNETWLTFINIVEKICSETTATISELIIVMTKYIGDDGRPFIITPTKDIIKLLTTNQNDVKNLYDPFADDGTLLTQIGNVINVENYYGQHPDREKCIMAKMTLLTNGVNYKNIFIKCNDITEKAYWDVKFDLCVTIPPFGRRDILSQSIDTEFGKFYLKSKSSEIIYLFDMLSNLEDEGTIKILLPDAILRSSQNKKINQYLVDNEFISTIIALPQGLFETVATQTALVIINKSHAKNGIYYLNMRNAETKRLIRERAKSIEDIDDYIKILSNKEEIELTSNTATIDDIKENDYNLAINRYVDLEKLEEIDIKQTIANIKSIKKELKQVDEELNAKIGGLLK